MMPRAVPQLADPEKRPEKARVTRFEA